MSEASQSQLRHPIAADRMCIPHRTLRIAFASPSQDCSQVALAIHVSAGVDDVVVHIDDGGMADRTGRLTNLHMISLRPWG